MNNWAVFIGGAWHGRVYPQTHYLVEFGVYGLNYRQIGPTQKASFGRVRILSMDGVDACSQVWIREDGPGEGLVVVLDGEKAPEQPTTSMLERAKELLEKYRAKPWPIGVSHPKGEIHFTGNRITGMLGPIDPPSWGE